MLSRRERQALGALFRRRAVALAPVWTESCPRCGARLLLEGADEATWQRLRAVFSCMHACRDD